MPHYTCAGLEDVGLQRAEAAPMAPASSPGRSYRSGLVDIRPLLPPPPVRTCAALLAVYLESCRRIWRSRANLKCDTRLAVVSHSPSQSRCAYVSVSPAHGKYHRCRRDEASMFCRSAKRKAAADEPDRAMVAGAGCGWNLDSSTAAISITVRTYVGSCTRDSHKRSR